MVTNYVKTLLQEFTQKNISYKSNASLTIIIEVFKHNISNTEINNSDFKLGHYVVKKIEEIDKKLKKINSLK